MFCKAGPARHSSLQGRARRCLALQPSSAWQCLVGRFQGLQVPGLGALKGFKGSGEGADAPLVVHSSGLCVVLCAIQTRDQGKSLTGL